MDDLISTKDAATMLGVGATAIKRWADAGEIPCVRTAGGHRRFRRADLVALLKEQQPAGSGMTPESVRLDEWLEALVHTQDDPLYVVESLLLAERARHGAWHRVATYLGEVLEEIGERWAGGQLSIIEEHLASARLTRAIENVCARMPTATSLPTALLVTAGSDDHTLGLSLVELCLREAGWRTLWAGRATPAGEIVSFVESGVTHVVAASASEHSQDSDELARWLREVGPACEARGVHLLLGGKGAWPRPLAHGALVSGFAQLVSYLAGIRL